MKCRLIRGGLLVVALAKAWSAGAVPADNPYHTILDRNPFGLNPPPSIQPTNSIEPPKNIKFNGITYVGGVKKAFFTIPGKDAKDPPQYVTLAETERVDVLEVTRILKEEGEVEVVNSGIKMVLNFKNNGNKGQTAPAVANVASAPVPQPTASSVIYNPSAEIIRTQQTPAPISSPVVAQPVQFAGGSRVSIPETRMDVGQQRANMLAQSAAANAAYDRGETPTFFKPQTDPKVYSPGGMVPVKMRPVPPPPTPPAPPGTAQ